MRTCTRNVVTIENQNKSLLIQICFTFSFMERDYLGIFPNRWIHFVCISIRSELKHSEFIWTKYCIKLKETEEKIIKDEKHLEELVKQKAEIHEDAKCWNSKIEDLNNKIAAQGNENIKILDACSEVMKATEKLKSTWEGNLQTIKQKLLNISEALNDLKCENGELQGENEEFLQKSANRSHLAEIYHLTFLSST
nr:uncharacterized protein LOC112994965 isoform X2 [Dromaius novaehollandiae]